VVTILGVDWAADMAATFGGDFSSASFVRVVSTTPGAHITGPATPTTATHTCLALGLAYERKYIDGTTVKEGDFKAIILRGSITPDTLPAPGQVLTCPPPGASVGVAVRIMRVLSVTAGFVTVHVRGHGL
jgi:hypothetical protein